MFEHRNEPLLAPSAFLQRFVRAATIATAVVFCSLALGMAGYHFLEQLDWTDAALNAAMLLGGMGPVNELHTTGGKLFAAFYALYSGIVFLVTAGVLFAPVFHRFLHHFHLELEPEDDPNHGAPRNP